MAEVSVADMAGLLQGLQDCGVQSNRTHKKGQAMNARTKMCVMDTLKKHDFLSEYVL